MIAITALAASPGSTLRSISPTRCPSAINSARSRRIRPKNGLNIAPEVAQRSSNILPSDAHSANNSVSLAARFSMRSSGLPFGFESASVKKTRLFRQQFAHKVPDQRGFVRVVVIDGRASDFGDPRDVERSRRLRPRVARTPDGPPCG